MIIKRYILLILFLGLIPFACFLEARYPYYNITDMRVTVFDSNLMDKKLLTTDSIRNDSVFIKIRMATDVVAQKWSPDFATRYYATTKERDGSRGLKDKVIDVTLVCNRNFCGIAPGTDLMNKVNYINSIGHYSDVNDFITELNMRPKSYSYYQRKELDYALVLWLKPNDQANYTFTLNIVFKSGNEARAQMDLVWK